MASAILTAMRGEDDPRRIPALPGSRVSGGRYDDPEHLKAVFRAHNAEVQEALPSGRLLTHELGSGSKPLCAFPGVPVPGDRYPTGNRTDGFHERRVAAEAERKAKDGS